MSASPPGGPPPHRIGPFRIERQLGQGGMGVVYLGRDETAGTLAAVKVIKPSAASDPVFRARLRREVAAARSVPRFCTAPVIAADLNADPAYVATEYIAAPTLAQRGELAGTELQRLAVGVAVALRAIHDHGVIHRDLKPANILLSRLGPRVIDFGIARLHGAETELTKVGQHLGTVPYMAPEQLGDGPVTPALDVFAWAGVVTYAATGAPPFGNDDATPFRILHSEPSLRGLAEPLRDLVAAALHKDPARRPTAAKLVNQLARRAPAVTAGVLRTANVPVRGEQAQTRPESDPDHTIHVPAPPAPTEQAARLRAEISELRITPGDRLVAAAWRTPAGAHRVIVRRAEGRPPRDVNDGTALTPTGARFTDRDVHTGVAYHYLLCVSYLNQDGQEVYTDGVRFTAVPARPPVPVSDLRLAAIGDEPGWLHAGFASPPAGTVELRELDAPPVQPFGARLPVADLPGQPVPAVPVPGGLKLAAPEQPVTLLAATISGELAALGPHRQWRPLAAPAGLRARRHGEEVLLTWHWPADVGVMEVCWRAADAPAEGAGWRCQRVTAARYRTEGGATLRPGGARRYEFRVAALAPGTGQELVGPPATTALEVPVPGAYTIAWLGWPDRQVTATITVDRSVQAPRLALVATSGDWPLSLAAGEVLAEAREVELAPGRPWRLRAPEPALARPYWLRCFAVGPVELRDPPRDQLRVG